MTLTDKEKDHARKALQKLASNPTLAMALADLFALGCYTRLQGHKQQGDKECRTAMRCLPDMPVTLLNRIMTSVEQHPETTWGLFSPHSEVCDLFSAGKELVQTAR